jgi:UDP-glucose 6-dehydrogenase
MVIDPQVPSPSGHAWDGAPVDMAVLVVGTPGNGDGGFDYAELLTALEPHLRSSSHVVVRSTVGLDFLDLPVIKEHAPRIGFSPEFYGLTDHSRRGVLDLRFSLFSDNVPPWFIKRVGVGVTYIASPAEVIVAKLADNAFLATKVTFFHELYALCAKHGLDFGAVRAMVTADPRIVNYHTACSGDLGWSSHCFDKDVPVYAALAGEGLVSAVLEVNRAHLASRTAR